MATTFESIASTVLTSDTPTINFNSIPQTYTDLRLVLSVKSSSGTNYVLVRLNNDSSGSYGQQVLYATTSGNSTARNLSLTNFYLNYNYSTDAVGYLNGSIDINSYSLTSLNKSALIQSFRIQAAQEASASIWYNNAAVTNINLTTTTSGFATGSTFTLYGMLRS